MERASIIGLVLGITAIVGGNLLEGGAIGSILQPTAAFIVFGGTAGATLLSFSFRDIIKALGSLRSVILESATNPAELIADVIRYSTIARRAGFIALEAEIPRQSDPFFRKALSLAVDGMLPKLLVETLEQDNFTFEDEQRRIAKVFETAGGFAPTIGILGAVLGLIHVMENLSDPSKLGGGIATAFVATVYGVGAANLLFLPMANKIKRKLVLERERKTLIAEGVLAIQEGLNPRVLEEKLAAYTGEHGGSEPAAAGKE